jgi:hypothetical protein
MASITNASVRPRGDAGDLAALHRLPSGSRTSAFAGTLEPRKVLCPR